MNTSLFGNKSAIPSLSHLEPKDWINADDEACPRQRGRGRMAQPTFWQAHGIAFSTHCKETRESTHRVTNSVTPERSFIGRGRG